MLAKLYASGFLPEVWVADDATLALRRQVTRRRQLVRQRTRLKNIIQSILHAHLVPPCPHANIIGISGRRWLRQQVLPEDERQAIERHLAALDQLGADLKIVEHDIAQRAVEDADIKRLMTLPGIDMVVASGLAAAIGDIGRFAEPQQLVAYLGLNPSVRQSGEGPAYHGRITKQGRGHARGMLVEAVLGGLLATVPPGSGSFASWRTMGGCTVVRPAAGLLPAHLSQARAARCCSRDGQKDRGDRLAHAQARRGLCVGAASLPRQEAA